MMPYMARPTAPINLSPEQNELLQAIIRSREVPHSLVQRAQIVLAVGEGRANKAIAGELGLCEETVGLWRKRWLQGCAGLESLAWPSIPEAPDVSLPPRLLRLLPAGAKVAGRDSHPLKGRAFARRTTETYAKDRQCFPLAGLAA